MAKTLHQDHALATAIGIFGVITVRSMGVTGDDVSVHEEEWTSGSLLETLTHEAAHIEWFRSNFDRDSQRLSMAALNERRAYLIGKG